MMVKILFFIAGYLFAGSAMAGWYCAKNKDSDGADVVFMVVCWPLYLAYLPFKFVYKQVKKSCIESLLEHEHRGECDE